MGVFSILKKMFGKKNMPEEKKLELPTLEKTELGLPEAPRPEPEIPKFEPAPTPSFEPPSYREISPPAPQPPKDVSREIELISAKLDTLKVMIDSLGHRLEALERKPRW